MKITDLKPGQNVTLPGKIEEEDLQECIGCEQKFNFSEMENDDAGEYYCKECWKEMAPVMQAEYDELVRNGEID